MCQVSVSVNFKALKLFISPRYQNFRKIHSLFNIKGNDMPTSSKIKNPIKLWVHYIEFTFKWSFLYRFKFRIRLFLVQTKSSQRNSCMLYFPLDLFHAVILFQRKTLLFSFDFFSLLQRFFDTWQKDLLFFCLFTRAS